MQTIKRTLTAALAALVLLLAVSVAAPAAFAADYQDGTYTVPFSIEGLGRHNVAWNTATVHVEGGKLYVDFTLERVNPRDHAPTYDWLKTDCGTFYPTTNEAAFTQTFSRVEVSSLGAIDVNAYSISMDHIMDYTLHIDGSSIPEAAPAPAPAPVEPAPTQPEPAPAPAPAPVEPAPTQPDPAPAPAPAPVEPAPTQPDPAPAPDAPNASETDPAENAGPDQETLDAFEQVRSQQIEDVKALAVPEDSDASQALIAQAVQALEEAAYDAEKTADQNAGSLILLAKTLESDLAKQRELDAEMTITDVPDEEAPVEDIAVDISPAPASAGVSSGDIAGAAAISAGTLLVLGCAAWLLRRKNG